MNYILQLSGFFQRVAADNRLNPTHVSLYMAIFQYWNSGRFQNPVSISRQELMRISKISAKATYHKCIKDLHTYGYTQYLPSFNPFKGSLVYLFDMQSSAKLVSTHDHTNIETSIEQALAPYIVSERKHPFFQKILLTKMILSHMGLFRFNSGANFSIKKLKLPICQ